MLGYVLGHSLCTVSCRLSRTGMEMHRIQTEQKSTHIYRKPSHTLERAISGGSREIDRGGEDLSAPVRELKLDQVYDESP